MPLDWSLIAHEFAYDHGALLDVVVSGTTMDDWQAFLDALRGSRIQHRYATADGEGALPTRAQAAFGVGVLIIDAGPVELRCHFFDPQEIELDLDPTRVTCTADLEHVVTVMALLRRATDKTVLLTPENLHEVPVFSLAPGARLRHHGA